MTINKSIRKTLGLLTGISLCFSSLSVMPVQAEEIFTCVLFATDETESIRLDVSNMNMNGDIVTNGKLISNLEASFNGTVYENQENEMPDLHSKIESLYFNGEVNHLKEDYSPEDYNENIGKATYIEGNFNSIGNNVAINSAALRTTGDIYIEGGSFSCSSAVVYSEQGDIHIDSDNFSMNGLIYAPNGKVYIECGGINLGGSVIAQSIEIAGGGGVNLNKNEGFMQSFGTGINAVEMPEPETDESKEGQSGDNNASSEQAVAESQEQNVSTPAPNTNPAETQPVESSEQVESTEQTEESKVAVAQDEEAKTGKQEVENADTTEQTGNMRFVIDVISPVEFKNPFEMLILLYQIVTGEKNIIIY